MKFYSLVKLKYVLFFSIFVLLLANNISAQVANNIEIITRNDFVNMDAAQKRILILKWNNYSLQNEVPASLEHMALAYYKQHNIDERIYHKYKVLFKTVSNEYLPISNRINACYFIIENYDAAIFPVEVVQNILDELLSKSK